MVIGSKNIEKKIKMLQQGIQKESSNILQTFTWIHIVLYDSFQTKIYRGKPNGGKKKYKSCREDGIFSSLFSHYIISW